jgi:glycosyltransferase involved in cell wall biosynthesis
LRVPNRRGGGLANRAAFREVLRREKPDLLLTYNWGAIEWAAANAPSLARHLHVEDGFGPDEAARQLPRRVWTRRLLLALRRVPVIVASRRLEALALSEWRMPASRVAFIANGVDFDGIAARRARRVRQSDSAVTIGTVAGLRAEKNVGRLIRAFAAVRRDFPARLVIVGDGRERSALERLARDLSVDSAVEFTGYLADPLSRLVEFDVFALSSDTEQLPIAMLEAMACGMPVVATEVGDVGLIVPDEARAGVAQADDASFERALRRVLESRSEWDAWGGAGRARVRTEYTLEGMVDAWRDVFRGEWRKVFRQRFHRRNAGHDPA